MQQAAGRTAQRTYIYGIPTVHSVSVRDILAEVGGTPGVFYYYFKSKQDIYLAAMEDYITHNLERKCELMCSTEMLTELIVKDISEYAARFGNSNEDTVSDASYKVYDPMQMIGKLIKPYSVFMLQGISERKSVDRLGITEENTEATAAFVLYGIREPIYNDRFTGTKLGTDAKDMEDVVKRYMI